MPRKPNTPCAGGCGKLLWTGTTSRAAPICQSCRRAFSYGDTEPSKRQAICALASCGRAFTSRRVYSKTGWTIYCSKDCVDTAQTKWATPQDKKRASNRRRQRMAIAAPYDHVTDLEILQRDEWTCWLCGTGIEPAPKWPDPASASIDHLIPLSRGGTDIAANKRAAHLGCNTRRGTRMDLTVAMHLEDLAALLNPDAIPAVFPRGKPCKCGEPVLPAKRICAACFAAREAQETAAQQEKARVREAARAERESLWRQVLDLRQAGLRWQAISDQLGLSGPGTAYQMARSAQKISLLLLTITEVFQMVPDLPESKRIFSDLRQSS